MPKINFPTLSIYLCVIAALFVILGPKLGFAGDSSNVNTGFNITKRGSSSIIGNVTDRRICRYHVDDERIHCTYQLNSPEKSGEYLVESAQKPIFRGLAINSIGSVRSSKNKRYAFTNGLSKRLLNNGSAYIHCKLALQFKLASLETLWIWYDEIRFSNNGAVAYLDTNGDQQADLAVKGFWTGLINGTRRWEPINPTNNFYSNEQKTFPARPYFKKTGTLWRNCRPTDVIVAQLVPAGSRIQTSISGDMRRILNLKSN